MIKNKLRPVNVMLIGFCALTLTALEVGTVSCSQQPQSVPPSGSAVARESVTPASTLTHVLPIATSATTAQATFGPTLPSAPPATVSTMKETAGPMSTTIPSIFVQPTPDTRYLVTLPVSPSLSQEEVQKQIQQIVEDRDQRAQKLYHQPSYLFAFEFANPLFKRVFPDVHMYAIWTNSQTTANVRTCTTMVSQGDKDYAMPEDFNRLMLDANKLDKKTRDELAQALVIAALPTQEATSPVMCGAGKEIDVTEGVMPTVHFTYEIECQVADIPFLIRFYPFDEQFHGGALSWGPMTGTGWRQYQRDFGTD
jgi:hypothetical protein